MPAETPHTSARKVCGYITNDNDVIKHVKRMWGVELPLNDVARIRRDYTTGYARKSDDDKALPLAPPVSTHSAGRDPLLKALASYHAKRSKGKARLYWEKLAA